MSILDWFKKKPCNTQLAMARTATALEANEYVLTGDVPVLLEEPVYIALEYKRVVVSRCIIPISPEKSAIKHVTDGIVEELFTLLEEENLK